MKLARLHLLPQHERLGAAVSSRSFWDDHQWHLDHEKPGVPLSNGTMNWAIDMGDATTLIEPKWVTLLEDCKLLAWSLMTDARSGRAFDVTTIAGNFRQQLGKLLRWMTANSYSSFCQIDAEASWEFYDHTVAWVRAAKEGELDHMRMLMELQILKTIYRQSTSLEDVGVRGIPEPPYDGESTSSLAKGIANAAVGWIKPLPDEIALSVLAQCTRWMGSPVEDVIRLRDIHLNTKRSTKVGQRFIEGALASFKFSTIEGDSKPWRDKLGTAVDFSDSTGAVRTSLVSALRGMMGHASAACIGLIQGTTGMRISEIAALRTGIDVTTGLPRHVKVERSKTGLNELFFLESQVTKIHEGRPMRWVLGMRPAGTTYLPPAIDALLALERLYEPWRKDSDLPWLLISPPGTSSLSRIGKNAKPETRNGILKHMKSFVAQYGGLQGLPDVLKTRSGSTDIRRYKTGEGFRTHQWRKTFALYILRTDSRMLPALAQHFKHMSLAMTEQGYIGNDPELLDSIESVRRQRTVQFLLNQAMGGTPIAGGMADMVREHQAKLAAIVAGSEGQVAYNRMEAWVVETDLRIWYAEHGKCFISLAPNAARCHSLGKTDPWLKLAPNYAHQNASTCNGCKCFAVDGEHVEFWRDRYQSNSDLLKSVPKDRHGEYRVALERVRQSASVLRAIGEQAEKPES